MYQNNNNFGGGMGYPQYPNPGVQYAPRQQAKMTQTLTAEQIKKLRGTGASFDLHISQPEMWKAICTHKENGNIVLVENADGTVTCPICGETFTVSYLDNNQVAEAVAIVNDICQSVKTMYLDIPEEMATQYFQIIPLLNKLPKLYEIAKNNFNMYDQSNPVMQGNSAFGFNALNAFTSPAFGQGMMGGNPALYNPGYVPQPQYYGVPQQPVGNPFGYNDPGYQVQVPQQNQQQPAQTQQQTPTAQDNNNVNAQKVFNV